MSPYEIELPILITNNTITFADGKQFHYLRKDMVVQRGHRRPKRDEMCEQYILKDTYDSIYIFKNRWAFYRPIDEASTNEIMTLIEYKKRDVRIGNKYQKYVVSDKLSFFKMFKMFRDLTGACFTGALGASLRIYKKLHYNIFFTKISIKEALEESKKCNYGHNYLFTEYFEEEAN